MYLEKIKELSNDSKYTKWYISIIEKYISKISSESYQETHHILPKSFNLGGENDLKNLVSLPPRVHYICHKLLCKMIIDDDFKNKMIFAFWQLSNRYNVSSKDFDLSKKLFSKVMKELWATPEFRQKVIKAREHIYTDKNWLAKQSEQKRKFFEDNPEEKEKFVQAGLLGAKIKRDLDPCAWVAASMGNEESRAKCKETHNSKEFSEKCRQRELLKGSEELSRLAKERNKKGIQKGIEKYGSEAAFRDAHAEKIRGRVKIFNIKLKISKVVKDRNEYSEWKIFSELTEEEKLIFKKEPYSSNKEYKSKWIFNQDTLELRKMRVHISEDFILPDGFRFGKK
jgi:hypothetical protein